MARTNLAQFYSMILVKAKQTNLRPSLPRNRKCGRQFHRWRQTPLLINPRFPPSSSSCECVQTNNTTRAFPLPPLFPALKAPSFLPLTISRIFSLLLFSMIAFSLSSPFLALLAKREEFPRRKREGGTRPNHGSPLHQRKKVSQKGKDMEYLPIRHYLICHSLF